MKKNTTLWSAKFLHDFCGITGRRLGDSDIKKILNWGEAVYITIKRSVASFGVTNNFRIHLITRMVYI